MVVACYLRITIEYVAKLIYPLKYNTYRTRPGFKLNKNSLYAADSSPNNGIYTKRVMQSAFDFCLGSF
jgi:hypothetical protein